ncbi:uncharacterized protein LOC121869263 [Homarus americanus]|uniref:uncharacterized protein LOC121869263 n=1 Tax=Homarus americanus TaxID=6706 RepID=UPI001C44E107|nr:uncharacterized protein LOC121869263 [Homarus americanus]
MFAANNLPDMEFPNDVPSSEIFDLIYKPAETTSQAHITQSQATTDKPPQSESSEEGMEEDEEEQEPISQHDTVTQPEQAFVYSTPKKTKTGIVAPPPSPRKMTENQDLGEETGIRFYTCSAPQILSTERLLAEIREGRVKYTYTDTNMEDHHIETLIKRGRILTKYNRIEKVEQSKYRKIRLGLHTERRSSGEHRSSKMPQTSSRHHHS